MSNLTTRLLGRRTLAIATAFSLSLGAIAVPSFEGSWESPVAGASAAELPGSSITSLTLLHPDTGEDFLDLPDLDKAEKSVIDELNNKWYGKNLEMHIQASIPDNAKAGDVLRIKTTSIEINFRGTLPLKIDDVVVGELRFVNNHEMHLTINKESEKYIGRQFSAGLGASISKINSDRYYSLNVLEPKDTDIEDVTQSYKIFSVDSEFSREFINIHRDITHYYSRQTVSSEYTYNLYDKINFKPISLNKGSSLVRGTHTREVGAILYIPTASDFNKRSRLVKVDEGPTEHVYDDILAFKEILPDSRDVTYTYSIEDEDPGEWISDSNTLTYVYRFNGRSSKSEPAAYNDFKGPEVHDYEVNPIVTKSEDGKTLTITYEDVPKEIYISEYEKPYWVSIYRSGKTIRETVRVVDPLLNSSEDLGGWDGAKTWSGEYVMPALEGFAAGERGYSDIDFKIQVNGDEADNPDQAVRTNGSGSFTASINRKGNIGDQVVTIHYPEGVTNPDGTSELVHTFADGLAFNETVNIDLGELNVAPDAGHKFTLTSPNTRKNTEISDSAYTMKDKAISSVSQPSNGQAVITMNHPYGNPKSFILNIPEGAENISVNGQVVTISWGEGSGLEDAVLDFNSPEVSFVVEGSGASRELVVNTGGGTVRIPVADVYLESIDKDSEGNYVLVLNNGGEVARIEAGSDLASMHSAIESYLEDNDKAGEGAKLLNQQIEEIFMQSNEGFKGNVSEIDENLKQGFDKIDSEISNLEQCVTGPHVVIPSILAMLSGIAALAQVINIPAIDGILGNIGKGNPQMEQLQKMAYDNRHLAAAGIGALGLLGLLLVPGLCNSGTLIEQVPSDSE